MSRQSLLQFVPCCPYSASGWSERPQIVELTPYIHQQSDHYAPISGWELASWTKSSDERAVAARDGMSSLSGGHLSNAVERCLLYASCGHVTGSSALSQGAAASRGRTGLATTGFVSPVIRPAHKTANGHLQPRPSLLAPPAVTGSPPHHGGRGQGVAATEEAAR